MIGALYDARARSRDAGGHRLELPPRAVGVPGAGEQEEGLPAAAEEAEIVGGQRGGDEHHAAHPALSAGHPASHPRPERIADDAERRGGAERLFEQRQGAQDVFLFALAPAVGSPRRSHAPEVEAKCREPRVAADLGGPHHNRIVHVAPVEGMRMAERHASRWGRGGSQSGFQGDGPDLDFDGLFHAH
ncbi:MAG: hypothetical protein A3I03_13375 [Candidatus Rokubacteria bacterium RIFCSPLOWO2_02_FULL_68_19]|nr:MAG: hypothetical protein A3I03_13375 [Candidatus Rokubacteria bacterium RIFCSPLOWO2_02_FULL_68_19]